VEQPNQSVGLQVSLWQHPGFFPKNNTFPARARCSSRRQPSPFRHRLHGPRQFWDDTVHSVRPRLKAIAEAGCRYVKDRRDSSPRSATPSVRPVEVAGDAWKLL